MKIYICKANFVQENGLSMFINNLSIFESTTNFIFSLGQQDFGIEQIKSLSQTLLLMKNLNLVKLKLYEKILSLQECQLLLNSISQNNNIQSLQLIIRSNNLGLEDCFAILSPIIQQKSLKYFILKFITNDKQISDLIEYKLEKSQSIQINLQNIRVPEKNGFSLTVTPFTLSQSSQIQLNLNFTENFLSENEYLALFSIFIENITTQAFIVTSDQKVLAQKDILAKPNYQTSQKCLYNLIFELNILCKKASTNIRYELNKNSKSSSTESDLIFYFSDFNFSCQSQFDKLISHLVSFQNLINLKLKLKNVSINQIEINQESVLHLLTDQVTLQVQDNQSFLTLEHLPLSELFQHSKNLVLFTIEIQYPCQEKYRGCKNEVGNVSLSTSFIRLQNFLLFNITIFPILISFNREIQYIIDSSIYIHTKKQEKSEQIIKKCNQSIT
ncbi:hypothetical protein ABPG72_012399 [Tetrahymena utriculariae]